MRMVGTILGKIGQEIDDLTNQIADIKKQVDANKHTAVSEIFESEHNSIDIITYRDNDAFLKNKIRVLRETRTDKIKEIIKILEE